MSASIWISRIAATAFWTALLLVFALTLAPIPVSAAGLNDKLAHFAGFFGLALLGVLAWGRPSLPVLALALPIIGGFIEFIQAMPWVEREPDVVDWLADVAGAAAVIAPAWAVIQVKERRLPD